VAVNHEFHKQELMFSLAGLKEWICTQCLFESFERRC